MGKYEILARDASSAGDRVAAENYMQHAEHYLRVSNAIKEKNWIIKFPPCVVINEQPYLSDRIL